MSLRSHIEFLRAKKRRLDKQVDEESTRPGTNGHLLRSNLKRRKLRMKDEIFGFRKKSANGNMAVPDGAPA